MREMRFRAWDGERMLYDGDYWLPDDLPVTGFNCYPVSITNGGIVYCRKKPENKYVEVISEGRTETYYHDWEIETTAWIGIKVMQYTGLHDSRGKEIYEGDIVRAYGYIYKVSFDFIGWIFIDGDVGYRADTFSTNVPGALDVEIIHNIYENPELLEGEDG